jgi:hypothetical protein
LLVFIEPEKGETTEAKAEDRTNPKIIRCPKSAQK